MANSDNSQKSSRALLVTALVILIVFGGLAVYGKSTGKGPLGKLKSRAGLAAVVQPELPRVFINSAVVPTPATGRILNASTSAEFQAALNSAVLGDTIVLTAGVTYTAPDGGFVLTNKTSGSGWITIRTSNMAGLPTEGTRAKPTHASAMPKILNTSVTPAISTAPGAHHYRLIGLEVTVPTTQTLTYQILRLGDTGSNQDTMAEVPHNIILDRMYVHGHVTLGTQRCLALNTAHTAVIDSYFSDCHIEGFDSQAIAGWNGPGPYKINNNYLEGAGENFMLGGSDPSIPNLVAADIEFRHNYVAKPLTWYPNHSSYAGRHWTVKNLFELKAAQRILIDGNIFEHNWPDAQSGSAILFTVRNQDGGCTGCTVEDVTFTNNILRSVASGMSMLGHDYIHPSKFTQRLKFANNVFEQIGTSAWPGSYGADMVMVSNPANAPLSHIVFDHNTFLQSGSVLNIDSEPFYGVVVTNNIFNHGSYGIFGSGKGEGNLAMGYYLPDVVYAKNAMIGGNANIYSNYPGNFYPPDANSVGFTNYNGGAGGDYRLTTSSSFRNAGTDGKDLGADITALNAAVSGVVQGTPGSGGLPNPTPPPSPTPTPTSNPNPTPSPSPTPTPSPTPSGTADKTPPVTTLTAPLNGATVSGTVAMSATATDNVAVDIVYFYVGDLNVGNDTTAPYNLNWDSRQVPDGQHRVVAYAWDKSANRGDSAFATITVNNGVAPTPEPSPTPEAVLNFSPTSLSFTAQVGGSAPAPKTVTLSNTGNLAAAPSLTTSHDWCHVTPALVPSIAPGASSQPITVSVGTPSNQGQFFCTITARRFANDPTPTLLNVSYTVGAVSGDTTAPVTAVISPINSGTVPIKAITTIQAQASDNSGVITKVEFYINGALNNNCTDTVAPYSCNWKVPGARNKIYRLEARAYDASGNIGRSTVVTVTAR